MRIRGDLAALRGWRNHMQAIKSLEQAHVRLSSGLRINYAADDASGLSISQRLRGQFRGLSRASLNALEGVGLIRTAEGAMNQVHDLLHRGSTLALQAANGVLSSSDREFIQLEMSAILQEIDRISDTTQFNGRLLLNSSAGSAAVSATLTGLRSGWLEQSESVIASQYGLTGDGTNLTIILESSGIKPAWIEGTAGMGGKLDNVELHINLAEFGALSTPDGGAGPLYNDRKVASALTQAVLARNTNYLSLPNWFTAGAGEYIAGRDEELASDVALYGTAGVANALNSWADDSVHQSAAYAALKYLDSQLPPFSMADVMSELSMGNDLDTALLNTLGIDAASFLADFQANGAAFIASLNLSDTDVGAIGGGDASGVIPNGGTYSLAPLAGFSVIWPSSGSGTPVEFGLQVGANEGDQILLKIAEVSTFSLGLLGIDVVARPNQAVGLFTTAVNTLSQMRSHVGSIMNRLEHVVNVNGAEEIAHRTSDSRITDADFALEVAALARQNILVTGAAMVQSLVRTNRETIMRLLET